MGRLGDIAGRRRLLLAGVFLFTVASVLCGAAPTLWLLVAARAAQGLGAALMMTLTMAFVGETVPRTRTGSAMGLLGTMSAIGTALGPSLGGLLIAVAGWWALFLVMVPLGIAALVLAQRHLPADRREPKDDSAGFDTVGTLLLALTLAAYALAMTLGRGSFGPLNIVLLLAAAFGAGLFVVAESRAPSPLIRLAMLRDPVLSTSLAMSALVSAVSAQHRRVLPQGVRHDVLQACPALLVQVRQDLLAHARRPEALDVRRNAFERFGALWHGREEQANAVGHADQVVVIHDCQHPAQVRPRRSGWL